MVAASALVGAFTADHPQYGAPKALYTYRDEAGAALSYTALYSTLSGAKLCAWHRSAAGWVLGAQEKPYPLYGLDRLAADRDSTVLVLPAEADVDAYSRLCKTPLGVTNLGGEALIDACELGALADRRVILWPRASELGRAACDVWMRRLAGLAREVHIVENERDDGVTVARLIENGLNARAIAYYVRTRRHVAVLSLPTRPLLEAPTRPVGRREAEAPQDIPQEVALPAATVPGSQLPDFKNNEECWRYFKLAKGSAGHPYANLDNTQRILALHPQTNGRFSYDLFAARVLYDGKIWNADAESRATVLTTVLQREVAFPLLHTPTLIEAVEGYATQRKFHPVKQMLEALPPHDGTKRLADLFSRGYGATPNAYTSAAGVLFLCSAIARIYSPGCIVRHTVVLEGEQEAGKTQSLHDLFDPWMLEAARKIETKDFDQEVQAHWCVELAELTQLLKSDPESVKATLTRRDDYYRASYGRRPQSHPRQCIFVGTTNAVAWQIDPTGGARFVPIECGAIDRPWIQAHRAQLFAEALALYRASVEWWQLPRELALAEQEARFEPDAWEGDIRAYCERRAISPGYVEADEILKDLLELKSSERTTANKKRVVQILKHRLRWRLHRTATYRRYYPPVRTGLPLREREPGEDDDIA